MPTKAERELKKRIARILSTNGIEPSSSGRGEYHIRFPLEGDANKFFKRHGIEVIDHDSSISSKYETHALITTKEINRIPVGTVIPWVNNFVGKAKTGSTLFGNKDLTPDNLGLAGKTVNVKQLESIVERSLGDKYDSHITEQLMYLIDASKTKNTSVTLRNNKFKPEDLAKVSADFGEILSAVWSMHSMNFKEAYFPRRSNEPLVDFYGVRMGIQYPISVKSGSGGGKVTVQNIIDKIKARAKTSKLSIDDEAALFVFKIVAENPMKEQMVKLHQYMETDAIKELGKIMNQPWKKITLDSIKKWVSNKTNEELKVLLSPFWKTLNTKLTNPILNGRDKVRLIISPLGESIWKILNNSKEIKQSLTNLARQVALIQVNVDVKTKKLLFKATRFRDANFMFSWAGYAGGNKLGFKMILKN